MDDGTCTCFHTRGIIGKAFLESYLSGLPALHCTRGRGLACLLERRGNNVNPEIEIK